MSGRLFTKATLILTASGLALNVLLVWLTGVCNIPLYLDSIGTVIVAALGGMLPGIAVGFLTNFINAMLAVSPDPMTLYYGFLSVLIAIAIAFLSQKGLLTRWYGRIIAVAVVSLIGGALGSVFTWVLYGFSFGQGISAPFAEFLYNNIHISKFAAQFFADMCIDLIDKIITIAVMCAVLYLLPMKAIEKLPLGYIYRFRRNKLPLRELQNRDRELLYNELSFRKRSIRTKITLLITISTTILSIIAIIISIYTYREKLISQYSDMCTDAAAMMVPKIDADRIDEYLELGSDADGYVYTELELYDILDNAEKIKYMYVYSIRQDGCHVVFDLYSDGLEGEPAGTVVPFDESFPYLEQVLSGKEIPPFITNDTYGWLLTVYKPVVDSHNNVVAYAAADIAMDEIRINIYTFFINITSLLFGLMMIIITFALWYLNRRLLEPIGVLEKQAQRFDYDGTQQGSRVRDSFRVETGDELEELFNSMCHTEDAIAEKVASINRKNVEISLMQRNIIYTLANMVENRDGNTGGHIKRTARYVRLIASRLKEFGIYSDIITDEYIKQLYNSAPLHDLGKIKVPDAILNKPGRLTDEEFEVIKKHPLDGREILLNSLSDMEDTGWLSMAIDVAAYHHEKWDGTGYPNKLSGEDIPLSARIMAVSDVFDALVSERSYKKPFSYEEAMSIIKEQSGTHFDPQIVFAFASCEDEIKQIMSME